MTTGSKESWPPEHLQEYRYRRPLGKGAMGEVYLYQDENLDRNVAIKFMVHSDEISRRRFAIEARAAARLSHQNIVTIHRVGEFFAETGDTPRPYLVSEYVRGSDLARCLRERGPLSWERALTWGLGIARGLAAAHRRNVLHRDIKPENIIVDDDNGQPKIADFGVAKLLDHRSPARARARGQADADEGAPGQPLTRDGVLIGTPHYAAPEIWRGEPARASADVYSLGVVLYEMCTGQAPYHDTPRDQLAQAVTEHKAPTMKCHAPDVDERFATIVDRCLARAPGERYADAAEVRDALEELSWLAEDSEPVAGNPYRGLLAFDSQHQRLFFGRESDIIEVHESLSAPDARALFIVGESGIGKSSLARAGVLPRVGEHGLDDMRTWVPVTIVPGRQPVRAFTDKLARRVAAPPGHLGQLLDEDVESVVQMLRRSHGDSSGTLVFIDQLEELITVCDERRAHALCRILATLLERTRCIRLLATARHDQLASLARLPALGRYIDRGLFILRPIPGERLPEVIKRPARLAGFRFEAAQMIDELATVAEASSGLPLLQFALAELWPLRDQTRCVIPRSALAAIGRIEGALSRHADGVMAQMSADVRAHARSALIELVSSSGLRARMTRTESELIADHRGRRLAVNALVQGRLLVVGDSQGTPVYELAHEALIDNWQTLRAWLDERDEARALGGRLATAAASWQAGQRDKDDLWRGRQLRAAEDIHVDRLSEPGASFLRASRSVEVRARWLRRLAVILPFVVAGAVYGLLEYRARRVVERQVNALLVAARSELKGSRRALQKWEEERERALTHFKIRVDEILDARDAAWHEIVFRVRGLEQQFSRTEDILLDALRRAPNRVETQSLLVQALYGQLRLALLTGDPARQERLLASISHYDKGQIVARWNQTRHVRIDTRPAGMRIAIERYRRDPDGRFALESYGPEQRAPARLDLPPGSYRFRVPATPSTAEVLWPVFLSPDLRAPQGEMQVTLSAPGSRDVPTDDFVYIPAGEFQFGIGRTEREEILRRWLETTPVHTRRTDAFFIARHETTYRQWLAFLRERPDAERAECLPDGQKLESSVFVRLCEVNGRFEFHFGIGAHSPSTALEGQPFHYAGRTERAFQDWRDFPVTGVSFEQVRAYLTWLDGHGGIPGARLCRRDEWERAARGADERRYPHGDFLDVRDANFDRTYGRNEVTMGPDVVGSFPASNSPFGIRDALGNARELVIALDGETPRWAGASFYHTASDQLIGNGGPLQPSQRFGDVGFRVCVTAAESEP